MDFHVLGPLEVHSGGTVVPVRAPTRRSLLATLLLSPNQVVTCNRLIEALWGQTPPASALANLRSHVAALRQVLSVEDGGSARLVTRSGGYLLLVESGELDLAVFDDLVAQGKQAVQQDQHAIAAQRFGQALELWHGEPLDNVPLGGSCEAEVARLGEARLAVVEDWLRARLCCGEHADVVGELRRLAGEHPLREPFWVLLMLALYRAGRQAAALTAYDKVRTHLADELGLDPGPQLRGLHQQILTGDPSLTPPPASPVVSGARCERLSDTNHVNLEVHARVLLETTGHRQAETSRRLPAARTRLIGRAHEVAEIAGRLTAGEARLLTLTGPGGVGKTRLAMETAAQVAAHFTDGVALVSLASVHDPDLVLATIASSLAVQDMGGMPLREALQICLRDRHVLVLLDNMEHLLDAAPEVGWLLDAAPRLTVLATSRSPLRIHGEHIRQIEPLDAQAAVDLFTERANQADSASENFDPTVVDAICRRLDRLPLAIELAAAQTRLLPPAALLDQLDQSHDLLVDGARDRPHRQRTLRSTIAWSYDLLDADEQAMLRSVAIFAGGWTLEAAAAVADTDQVGTLELHSRLLDSSLITRQQFPDTDEVRFTMLETIRTFALARSDEDEGRAQHAAYFEDFTKAARADVEGPSQRVWLDRLRSEHDNLRAAMRWLLDHGQLDRFAEILMFWQLWVLRGRFSECGRWAGEALTAANGSLSASCRAGVLAMFGVARYGNSPDEAVDAVEESVRVAKQTDDLAAQAMALMHRGYVAAWAEDNETAELVFAQAATAMGGLGWMSSLAAVRGAMAHAITMLGRHEEANRLLVEIEAQLRQEGGPYDLAAVLNYRGFVLLRLGDGEGAERVLKEAVVIWGQLGASFTMMYALDFLAAAAALGGQQERSARLAGAASVLVDRFGPSTIVQFHQQHQWASKTAIAEIGEDVFDALFQEGRGMTWNQVVSLATSTAAAHRPATSTECHVGISGVIR